MGSFIFLRWVWTSITLDSCLTNSAKASFLLLWLHRRQLKLQYRRKTTWYCIGVWWSLRKSSRIWQTTNFLAKNLTWWFLINSWKTMPQMSHDFSLNYMWVADSLQWIAFFHWNEIAVSYQRKRRRRRWSMARNIIRWYRRRCSTPVLPQTCRQDRERTSKLFGTVLRRWFHECRR